MARSSILGTSPAPAEPANAEDPLTQGGPGDDEDEDEEEDDDTEPPGPPAPVSPKR